jgi:putative tryptophan/tyrosine transport system substrate-binding protein
MRTLLLLLVLLAATPVAAQPESKVARVVFLSADPPNDEPLRWFDAFRQGLREHGWEEGRNLIIESRRTNGHYDQLDKLASELVRSKVDVIVTDSTPAARAAMKATQTIPIVLAIAADPVGTGLVANLAHPGGNVTGNTSVNTELSGKRLQLLREVIPNLARVAVVMNPENPSNMVGWEDAQNAALKQGVRLRRLNVRGESDPDRELPTVTSWRPDALWVFDDVVTAQYSPKVVGFAMTIKVPTLYPWREGALYGGLLSYGPSFTEMCRRAGFYVDKILRGAKPADLPIQQPTKFELIINLKTAKTLGIKIPESLLLLADEVIR